MPEVVDQLQAFPLFGCGAACSAMVAKKERPAGECVVGLPAPIAQKQPVEQS